MNIYFKSIVIITVVGVMAFASDTSFAQDKNNIDVVLVMDSSGSMKKTDPLSLRIPAAKLFISLLDENDRAGVISFSDKGYPVINLTPVDSKENKEKLLRATDKITSSGLYTNLYGALNKGLDLLSKDNKTGRAQIVIFMTDGMMDVGDPDHDKNLVDKINNELVAMFENNGVKVYAIAFTEQSDRHLLEKVSKRTGGFYNLALSDKDFHLIFTSIFESLKAPEMLPMSKNGFLIDTSIEEVTIVATKGSADTTIRLNSPDGKSYSSSDKRLGIEWFISNNFDMITVKNPVEGQWEILFSTEKNNKAYIITNLKLKTNFDQLYSAFGEPLDIKIWLEKGGSTIKEQAVLDKIDIYIEMSDPVGKTTKLEPFNKGEGIFLRRFAPFKAGNYKLRIAAMGKTFEREKTFIFSVAGVKESKEELNAKRTEKKIEKPVTQKLTEDKKDAVSWRTIITQFVLINLMLCIAGFIYIKRKKIKYIGNLNNLKNLIGFEKIKSLINLSKIKGLIKRNRKEEEQEIKEEENVKEVKKEEAQAELKEQNKKRAPVKEEQVKEEGPNSA